MFGTSPAESYHMRWFERHLPTDGCARAPVRDGATSGCRSPGRSSRALLQTLVDAISRNAAFPFMAFRHFDVGMVPGLVIGRVTFTGDLGYEIWVTGRIPARPIRSADSGRGGILASGLSAAGRSTPCASKRAFGTWAREYRPIYGPAKPGSSASSI